MAGVVFCLLLLFLVSTPLDPAIQSATLLLYLAAIFAMSGVLRSQHWNRQKASDTHSLSEEADSADSHDRETGSATIEDRITPAGGQPDIPAAEQTGSIILLTKQEHMAREIGKILAGWNRPLEVVGSCAAAVQHILNQIHGPAATPRVSLIIDTHNLEIDPVHLPALIKQETALASLQLIGIVTRLAPTQSQQLKAVGFTSLLNIPIDKSQLFLAISTEEYDDAQETNVVNLARYRLAQELQIKKRVLLADQDASDRNRLAEFLRTSGHLVKVVENGEQALDSLERQHFDMALINLQLPIMSGTQVIKLHRFTTPHQHWVNFIVMTDQTTPTTLRLCRDLRVKACLFKPVPTSALLEIIDSAPAIAPPLPVAIQRISTPVERPPETRFLHADLLDIKVLQTLDQLDNDKGFVPDLIAIFNRDSVVILRGLIEAIDKRDVARFIDLSNILMDNAGQLGAFALYEMCLTLQTMSPHELEATLTTQFSCLRELLNRTNLAFQHYLSELENQQSDHS